MSRLLHLKIYSKNICAPLEEIKIFIYKKFWNSWNLLIWKLDLIGKMFVSGDLKNRSRISTRFICYWRSGCRILWPVLFLCNLRKNRVSHLLKHLKIQRFGFLESLVNKESYLDLKSVSAILWEPHSRTLIRGPCDPKQNFWNLKFPALKKKFPHLKVD